jgi:hypothetical protein
MTVVSGEVAEAGLLLQVIPVSVQVVLETAKIAVGTLILEVSSR